MTERPGVFAPSATDWPVPDKGLHIECQVLVRKGNRLLLQKMRKPDWMVGRWALPWAPLLLGDEPEEVAKRIVREQLGMEKAKMKLLQVQSHIDQHWDIVIVYETKAPGKIRLGPDALEAQFFPKLKLPLPEIDEFHRYVIEALGRLR